MIVHLGVVLVAVGFAASHAYQHQTLLTMTEGVPAHFEGHSLVFRGTKTVNSSGRSSFIATIDVDGHPYYPAIEQFALSDQAVVSPAVHSTPAQDIYLDITDHAHGDGPPNGGGGLRHAACHVALGRWSRGRPRGLLRFGHRASALAPPKNASRGRAEDAHAGYGSVDSAEQGTIELPEPGKTGVRSRCQPG